MMTRRTPFRVFDGFIETGFEQRFQGLLRLAWHQRSWHVIVADPGSGKSMGIRDLVLTTTHGCSMMSGRTCPVLAVTAPKNDPKEAALGTALLRALGFSLRGRWSEHKYTLLSALPLYEVECLIIDDAHDLSMQHLILLKELTDQLRIPPYDRRLGLCLVTAGRGTAVPLKDILDQPETMWLQFRRRRDRLQPYCRIAGHTQDEVRDILATLEEAYHPVFPTLPLQKWTGTIYSWLTHPLTDPQSGGRVNMDQLMKFVTTALEWTYYQGKMDVTPKALEVAIDLLQNQHERIRVIDAPGAQKQAQTTPGKGQPTAPAQGDIPPETRSDGSIDPAPTVQEAPPQAKKDPLGQSEISSSKRGRKKKKAEAQTEATASAESPTSSQDPQPASPEVRAGKPLASPNRPDRAQEPKQQPSPSGV